MGVRVALSAKLAQGELLIADNLDVPSARTRVCERVFTCVRVRIRVHASIFTFFFLFQDLHRMLAERDLVSVLLVPGETVPQSLARASRNLPKCTVLACKGWRSSEMFLFR